MKQLVTVRPMELEMQDIPEPQINNGADVLIKLRAAGICGSDVHIYHGTSPVAIYPRVMGHEMVGVVDKTGPEVTKVKIGDRVIVDQIISCKTCYPCLIGRPNVCMNLKVRGVHIDGGYRQYLTAHENDLHIIPSGLEFEDAVMIEPMSIAFQAVSRAEITQSDVVFILGAGALGKSLIKAVQLTNATLVVADTLEQRLEEASSLGVQYTINSSKSELTEEIIKLTGGSYPSVSIDAAGFEGSLSLLADITCNAGRVITMAFLQNPSLIAQFKITAKELDIRGSRLQNGKFKEVIKAVSKGLVDVRGQVSHIVPFDNAKEAFAMIDSKDPSIKKIVLKFE